MDSNKQSADQPPPYSELYPPSSQSGYAGQQPPFSQSQPGYGHPQPGFMSTTSQPVYSQSQPYMQPQGGYGVPSNQLRTQQTTVVLTQPTTRPVGSCTYCGGTKREDFTACGIILAICFFPIGILCCLAMTERRCVNCGRM